MLRKTQFPIAKLGTPIIASMRPQRNAAENAQRAAAVNLPRPRFNEAAA